MSQSPSGRPRPRLISRLIRGVVALLSRVITTLKRLVGWLLRPLRWAFGVLKGVVDLLLRPFRWVRSKVRVPRFILVPALLLSRLSSYLWRPAFLFAAGLCLLAGIMRSLTMERPSLFAIYAAGVLAGLGVLTGLLALPTEGSPEEAEELIA